MINFELCTTDEIIKELRITKRTLSSWIREGKFPKPTKLGKRNFWKKEIVQTYIDKLIFGKNEQNNS